MENRIVGAGIIVMMIGAAIIVGVFERLGPIETPRGMARLGWGVVALGFLIALSQSTPTP